MLRKISLLALLVFAPSTSFAEELTCPMGDKTDFTMQQYTECLLNKYGPERLVTGGAVVGTDKDGKVPFADDYSIPMSATIVPLTPSCTLATIIYSNLTGNYNYNWCPTAAALEAWRDKWHYQSGRWTLQGSAIFHCNVAIEKAAMPAAVKTYLGCP